MNRTFTSLLAGAALLATAACNKQQPSEVRADLIVTDAKIYTADAGHRFVEAMAIRDGRVIYAGDTAGAMALKGPGTRVEALGGKLVLPGLIDMHIHPVEIADLDLCDLKSERKTLDQLSDFVKDCIERMKIPEGEWMLVDLWNFSEGNEPSKKFPTIRAALDGASRKHPIQVIGNDGHHAGFNSLALSMAENKDGNQVGLSARTLKSDFAAYKALIGVDRFGEPDGYITESAQGLMQADSMLDKVIEQLMDDPTRVPKRLNAAGITAIQDAAVRPQDMQLFDALSESGKLTAHVRYAQYFDFEAYRGEDGKVDFDRMLQDARAVRTKYLNHPLIQADAVKLFADGVIEGNPYSMPPTLPNGAMLKPFLQPIFGKDAKGELTVKGYVDTNSKLCKEARARKPDTTAFMKAHGFHPAQCEISNGVLEHPEPEIMEFVKRFHMDDFTLHIHAIGDRAVHVAINAIEAARAADGVSSQPDALAHMQIVAPEDVQRFGKNKLFAAYTYAWTNTVKSYDLTVMPFIDRIDGNSDAALYNDNNYVYRQSYPVASMQKAGGVLIAGSDAPVETRDPRPFYNMQYAVTRQHPGTPVLNAKERIGIRDIVDAYTINGARAMRMDHRIGSLETGKDADFIVVDANIFDMAKDEKAVQKIKDVKVMSTWLAGRKVYGAK